jgi:rod shape-determining protein MreB
LAAAASRSAAGNLMDEKIIEHLRHEHNLVIGERTAESIKTEVGSAYPSEQPSSMDVKGRDVLKGIPRTVSVRKEEIRQALSGCVLSIIQAIRVALERIPPELSADISDRGIVLTTEWSRFTKRILDITPSLLRMSWIKFSV